MRNIARIILKLSVVIMAVTSVQLAFGSPRKLRGWISDEGCARSRAAAGIFSGTNPKCAKECVANGKKIVLIVSDLHEVLEIANQNIARKNVGDYVEVEGNLATSSPVLEVISLRLISQGKVMCHAPSPGTSPK